MRIIITNTVALNVGDAAILKGEIKILKETFGDEIEIIVFDSNPKVAKKYYPEILFRELLYSKVTNSNINIKYMGRINKFYNILRFKAGLSLYSKNLERISKFLLDDEEFQSLSLYKTGDLIVSTGGTYLVENYSLNPRFFDFNLSILFRKPLMLFTQSLGPFEKHNNIKNLKRILPESFLILLRDEKSRSNLNNIGINLKNVFVTSDVAFALSNGRLIEKSKLNKGKINNPKIAISVREWIHFKKKNPRIGIENYKKGILDTCIHLIEKYNAKVEFISTCQGIEEYWTDDSEFALEIYNMLPDNYKTDVNVNVDFHSPDSLMEKLQEYDFVISTRLHMAIMSLNVGTPVLPIAYEFKTIELFRDLNQDEYILDIEDIESSNLIRTVDNFILNLPSNREILFGLVQREITNVNENVNLIRRLYYKEEIEDNFEILKSL